MSVPALLSSAGLAPLQWLRDGVDKWQAALALVCAEEGSARAAAQSAIALMPLSLVDSTRETATSSECAGLLASWYVVASLCVLLCCASHTHHNRAPCLACSLKLVQRGAEAVSGVDACPEVLHPVWSAAQLVLPLGLKPKSKKKRRGKNGKKHAVPDFVDALTTTIEDTVVGLDTIMNQANDARGALKLQQQALAPKAITSFDPLFEEDYRLTGGTMSSISDPKAQLRKLKREVRREQKGVARELRKDAQYLAKVRDEEFAARDKEREAKTKEIMSFLEQQQATFNQMVKQGVVKGGGSQLPVTKADRRKRKRGQ